MCWVPLRRCFDARSSGRVLKAFLKGTQHALTRRVFCISGVRPIPYLTWQFRAIEKIGSYTYMEEEKKPQDAQPEGEVVQPEDKKPDSSEPDWKLEKEKLEKRLEQAEHTIITLKKKPKEEAPAPEIDLDAVREEARAEAMAAAEEKIREFQLEQTKNTVESTLAQLVTDPDKRDVVRLIYDKRINKSGLSAADIQEDIRAAIALADAPVMEKRMKEIAAARGSQETRSNGNAPSADTSPNASGLTESEEQQVQSMAKRHGKSVDDVRKIFIANKINQSKIQQ